MDYLVSKVEYGAVEKRGRRGAAAAVASRVVFDVDYQAANASPLRAAIAAAVFFITLAFMGAARAKSISDCVRGNAFGAKWIYDSCDMPAAATSTDGY
ncbi:MAG: hypothetical protein LBL46_04445 [Rickettsiales bacterium]|jgi:hypothetical protein|nr:hypothetical protein [Rickettsiales bacterium]